MDHLSYYRTLFWQVLTFIENSIESSRKFEICQKILIVHMIRISIYFLLKKQCNNKVHMWQRNMNSLIKENWTFLPINGAISSEESMISSNICTPFLQMLLKITAQKS